MKIDAYSQALRYVDGGQPARADKPGQAAGEGKEVAADRTSLSIAGDKVAQLKAEAERAPDIRQDKVDALRLALSQGRYKVDDRAVADAMMTEWMGKNIGR